MSSLPRFFTARILPLLLVTVWAVPASAVTKTRIASVGLEYKPTAGPQIPEPVFMRGFAFEIERETGQARVVIDYTYPSQPAYGFDGGAGPAPTMAQIPGLRYDAGSRSILYEDSGRSVVCATVTDRKVFFWNRTAIVLTGACRVSSEPIYRPAAWNVPQSRTLDTFFEVD